MWLVWETGRFVVVGEQRAGERIVCLVPTHSIPGATYRQTQLPGDPTERASYPCGAEEEAEAKREKFICPQITQQRNCEAPGLPVLQSSGFLYCAMVCNVETQISHLFERKCLTMQINIKMCWAR